MNEIFLKLSQSKCKTNSKSVLDIRKVYLEDLLESIREKKPRKHVFVILSLCKHLVKILKRLIRV